MFSNNAIVHHITDTAPLALKLKYQAPALLSSFKFPSCLSGHKLSFTPIDHDYNLLSTALSSIPTFFWRSRMFDSLPTDPTLRKSLCYDLLDLNHFSRCSTLKFHQVDDRSCLCIHCSEPLHPYHYLLCPSLHQNSKFPPKFSPLPRFLPR